MAEPERVYPMRLQRFLSKSGVAPRRKAEDLMSAGRVRVNGEVVRELGSKVDPLTDRVEVDGRPVTFGAEAVYLMLNKPAGYISTMRDPQGRPTVAELVPTDEYPGLFCVGRLDRDTTGLLLFTTDGDMAQLLMHPSHGKTKRYVALVRGRATRRALAPLARGITVAEGPCAPAEAEVLDPACAEAAAVLAGREAPAGTSVVALTIHEGKKHQVKSMLAAVGLPVLRLHRDRLGPLELADVAPGKWRHLSEAEVARLRAEQDAARAERAAARAEQDAARAERAAAKAKRAAAKAEQDATRAHGAVRGKGTRGR